MGMHTKINNPKLHFIYRSILARLDVQAEWVTYILIGERDSSGISEVFDACVGNEKMI
jgi:hypothetical protein